MKKRMFGLFEAVFDLLYLAAAAGIGLSVLLRARGAAAWVAGVMALVLAGGDAFHLIPRVRLIFARAGGKNPDLTAALGWGKFVTSLTMTVFYLLLWQLGLLLLPVRNMTVPTVILWLLAAARILLCLMPQNDWEHGGTGLRWGILRNLPFAVIGAFTAVLFAGAGIPTLRFLWLAVLISFGCYLPVVLFAERRPMVGMLMLPKTCAYLWILLMCAASV